MKKEYIRGMEMAADFGLAASVFMISDGKYVIAGILVVFGCVLADAARRAKAEEEKKSKTEE